MKKFYIWGVIVVFITFLSSCSTDEKETLSISEINRATFEKYDPNKDDYTEFIKISNKEDLKQLKENLLKAKGYKGKLKMSRNADFVLNYIDNKGQKESIRLWFDKTITLSSQRDGNSYIYTLSRKNADYIVSLLEN